MVLGHDVAGFRRELLLASVAAHLDPQMNIAPPDFNPAAELPRGFAEFRETRLRRELVIAPHDAKATGVEKELAVQIGVRGKIHSRWERSERHPVRPGVVLN